MRKAFTLIELMVSITILSILMLFLYKSYADLNRTNKTYTLALQKLQKRGSVKKTLYLDLLMAKKSSILIEKSDKTFDFVSFMTKNSLHRRINPYVTYIVKEKVLYRLESRRQIKTIDINRDIAFDIDTIGDVEKFKLFSTKDGKKEFYLLDLEMSKKEKILLKVKILN